jgi:hypothetical protein
LQGDFQALIFTLAPTNKIFRLLFFSFMFRFFLFFLFWAVFSHWYGGLGRVNLGAREELSLAVKVHLFDEKDSQHNEQRHSDNHSNHDAGNRPTA